MSSDRPHDAPAVGDYLRNTPLPRQTGERFDLGDVVGRPLVLFFYLRDGGAGCTAEACAFRDLYPQFQALGAEVVGFSVDGVDSHARFAAEHNLPFPLLADPGAVACRTYAATEDVVAGGKLNISVRRRTVLADSNFRILKVYDAIADPAAHPAEVLADARALLAREEPRRVVQHAPVLLVPNVLPADVCRRLIELWETGGNEDSGSMIMKDGKTTEVFNYGHKIRRDHFMQKGSPGEQEVLRYVGARVLPEVRKAFCFNVTRKEDFRIACYDATRGGYFRPHRDNTTDGTAHRRFAMSLLLNDEYEGGHLRFPEYAPHTYRPGAGGAVVFSCSLLHEATDVTAGRRFVLLSFFYGEAEARQREQHARRTGGEYRA